MKENKLYAVCYVSGYTSDASIQVFTNRKDAERGFDRLIRLTFGEYLDDISAEGGWEEELSYPDILTKDKEHLRQSYEIHIDDPFDITWDGREVFERVYLEEIEVQ